MYRSIRTEYAPLLGAEVFDLRVNELTARQKYDLVFTRLLLQRPKVVFCIHPFKKAEVSIRRAQPDQPIGQGQGVGQVYRQNDHRNIPFQQRSTRICGSG